MSADNPPAKAKLYLQAIRITVHLFATSPCSVISLYFARSGLGGGKLSGTRPHSVSVYLGFWMTFSPLL